MIKIIIVANFFNFSTTIFFNNFSLINCFEKIVFFWANYIIFDWFCFIWIFVKFCAMFYTITFFIIFVTIVVANVFTTKILSFLIVLIKLLIFFVFFFYWFYYYFVLIFIISKKKRFNVYFILRNFYDLQTLFWWKEYCVLH